MTIADLTGWVIPAAMNQSWDHTYVTSALNDAWGCYGRSVGGTQIVSRPGNRNVADCLARPDHRAGLRYGVTGVCHQMANRILHPAQTIKVSGARGYHLSRKLWRDYGLGPWPELASCYRPDSTSSTAGGQPPSRNSPAASSRGSAMAQDDHPDPHLDWRSTAVARGIRLSRPMIDRLAAADRRLQDRQTRLIFQLNSHMIEPEAYLTELNGTIHQYLATAKSILGEAAYASIFGTASTDAVGLIDEAVFLASEAPHAQAPRPAGGAGGAMP